MINIVRMAKRTISNLAFNTPSQKGLPLEWSSYGYREESGLRSEIEFSVLKVRVSKVYTALYV